MANPFFSITSQVSPPATSPSIAILTVADSNLSHKNQHADSTMSLTASDDRGVASEASGRPLLFGPII